MSARRRQANSDPLPYVQVDRAVKPKSALLAGKMGVTNQHALGSLVEFWDLCGDPRELERVVEATPEGEEPQLVLERSDVELRFELASGHHLEVGVLLLAGLVEPQANGFRVRGMSRYFDPIQARIRARRVASAGGKASAESRRKSHGTAQPTVGESFGARFDGRFESGSGVVRTDAEPARTDSRSETEPAPNPSGQRSAVSGQRQSKDSANLFDSPPPSAKARPDKPPDPRHAPLVARLVDAFKADREAPYPFGPRDAKAVANLLARAEPDAIVAAWERALRHQGFPTVATLAQLEQHLAQFIAAPRADASRGVAPVGVFLETRDVTL